MVVVYPARTRLTGSGGALMIRWLAIFLLFAVGLPGQKLESVTWGFGGAFVANAFSPLTLQISNSRSEAFDGLVQLRSGDGGGRLIERVFIAAGKSRAVTFYPHLGRQADCSIRIGRQAWQRLSPVDAGEPATVYIARDQFSSRTVLSVPTIAPGDFPPSVTATDSLRRIVLDAEPEWGTPRRVAFLQWLYAGGELHLCDADRVEFTDELAVLNHSGAEQLFGQGVVFRHPGSFDEVRALVREKGELAGQGGLGQPNLDLSELPVDHTLGFLRQQVVGKQPRGLLAFLAFLYLGLIGPGYWYLAARKLSLPAALALFVVLVASFSFLIFELGRWRDVDETTVHAMALVRHVGGDAWDVTHHTDVFVTSGDDYRVRYDGRFHLFGTPSVHEAVNAKIDNGAQGSFLVDIPLFSHRGFVHRGEASLPAPGFDLRRVNGDELEVVRTSGPNDRLIEGGLIKGWLVRGEKVSVLRDRKGKWVTGAWKTLDDAFDLKQMRLNHWQYQRQYMNYSQSSDRLAFRTRVKEELRFLVIDRLGLLDEKARHLPDGVSVLFLVGRSPEALALRSDALGKEASWTLFEIPLRTPD